MFWANRTSPPRCGGFRWRVCRLRVAAWLLAANGLHACPLPAQNVSPSSADASAAQSTPGRFPTPGTSTVPGTSLTDESVSSDSKDPLAQSEEAAHRKVASWTFSRAEDLDFDRWPDGWKRQRDKRHPAYLPIEIVAHDATSEHQLRALDTKLLEAWDSIKWPGISQWIPPSVADLAIDRYVRIQLDGGAALIQGPEVPVDRLYRHRLSGRVFTESLEHDEAIIELCFFDADGKLLSSHTAPPIRGNTSWHHVQTELVAPPANSATMAARLAVRPIHLNDGEDIVGAAGFDDLVIEQLPQMVITTDQPLGIYDGEQLPTITARVLGLRREGATVTFSVWDDDNRIRGQTLRPLASKESVAVPPSPLDSDVKATPALASSMEGSANWQMPRLPPGYYRVVTQLRDSGFGPLEAETTFAILSKLPETGNSSPFGWTLPKGREHVDVKRLPDWLERLGVRIVKYPCWLDPEDRVEVDAIAWLVGRLQEKEIRTIGMLDAPPASIQAKFDERDARDPVAANFFRDSTFWQPYLEPIMTRLTLRVRTWQLGSDVDSSFLGQPNLLSTIKNIARDLQGFGQPIGVAICWPWLESLPPSSQQTWVAANRLSSHPLTANELDAYLTRARETDVGDREKAETWVVLDPIDAQSYDRESRIQDLVLRMATVRGHRVSATFISNPTDTRHGLLRRDWRPDELLVPWRTTATLLGDLARVGTLEMRRGSENVVFANGSRSVVMLWNPTPTTEPIYLGESVRQINVWGRDVDTRVTQTNRGTLHEVEVGPLPTFLIDVDPVLVAFRMSTRLVDRQIDSLLGKRQKISIEFTNPTRETISGEVRPLPLSDWEVLSRPQAFDLQPGRTAVHSFDVTLRNSAKIGPAEVEFDFNLRSTPPRRFTIMRPILVGPEGVEIEASTRLIGDELMVELTMRNRTDREQRYDCLLFPPSDRQYQRRQIFLPAQATAKRYFPWEGGESLIGKRMLLRAVEQGGERVLNHVIDVTR